MSAPPDSGDWLSRLPSAPSAPGTVKAPKRPQTRAEAFQAKADTAKRVNEERVQPGTCPKCSAVVLYGRYLGLLDVADAVPVAYEDAWQAVTSGARLYMVFNKKLKIMTGDARSHFGVQYVHVEHVSCGRITPKPIVLPKPEKAEDDGTIPFDIGLKPWRCWDCQELIQPENQAIVISHDGPRSSYYMCHCDKACVPVKSASILAQRKPKHPKINKLTGKYEEPKKGEVLPS